MSARSKAVAQAPLVSALLVLPFLLLELINRHGFGEGFPFPLFGFLWLLPIGFLLTLAPLIRKDARSRMGRGNLVVRVALLGLLAWLWTGIVIDQMPCFLGVPNCD
jgi:hypothetical protein